jgi:hypothetical protein
MAEPARELTEVRERPVLFSGEMVRAILDGRKTQTRRLVTAKSWDPTDMVLRRVVHHGDPRLGMQAYFGDEHWGIGCPFGVPGNRLWVRETWAAMVDSSTLRAKRKPLPTDSRRFRADGEMDPGFTWRPSIHMPRWASRLTLEITSVRVERLQEISEHDATAEGFNRLTRDCKVPKFRALWDSLYAKQAPWSDNPWVWVIAFQRIPQEAP